MYPSQIGRIVCQFICRSGCKCWNEMDVRPTLFCERMSPVASTTHETLARTSHWFDPHEYSSREREREQTFLIQPDVQAFACQR